MPGGSGATPCVPSPVPTPARPSCRDVVDEVTWARSRLIGPDAYPAAADHADRHPGVTPSAVLEAWASYNHQKARLGRLDFADLLDTASDLLLADQVVADAVRARWAHVTVDEYQDTDPAQQRLLDAILGDNDDLCVVGDPRQAIYSWKGADTTYLRSFGRRYPNARVVQLVRNYRSSAQILAWANRLATSGNAKPLAPTRPDGPPPTAMLLTDDNAEAAWVVSAIRRAISAGTPLSEIAVLYRFNATQGRFEAACARADIATTAGEDGTFFDRDEVRQILETFARTARADPDRPGLELLTSVLRTAGFDPQSPPDGQGTARARWESQQALLELVRTFEGADRLAAGGLLAEITGLAERSHGPSIGGVTLATLHRAKGLEWDVVFIVGAHDGAIPSTYAKTSEEHSEEERLLHVGVTRARRQLHLTWAATNGRGWTNRPSPFLDVLSPASKPEVRTGKGPGKGSGQVDHDRPGLSSADCPHCAAPLKGIAARRLGVCANCVTSAPGGTGQRARALVKVVEGAALRLGTSPDRLLTSAALLRLLDQRPNTAAGIAATTGVNDADTWAQAAAEALAD